MIAARSAYIALALSLTGCATSTPEMSIEASVAVDDAEIAEAPATDASMLISGAEVAQPVRNRASAMEAERVAIMGRHSATKARGPRSVLVSSKCYDSKLG